jgi:hypothetical protein
MMLVADKDVTLALTGTGDVLEPEFGVMAIGSGGNYALAAARALLDTDKDAEAIARKAMQIAGDICVYTNHNIVVLRRTWCEIQSTPVRHFAERSSQRTSTLGQQFNYERCRCWTDATTFVDVDQRSTRSDQIPI